jgi:methylthioribulose-1-phosphate dehydratase
VNKQSSVSGKEDRATLMATYHPLADTGPQVAALRQCGRAFYDRGWSLGTSSNYSVVIDRQPLELVITASGKDKGRLSADDFVRVDEEGNPVVPGQPAASAETLIHVALAGRLPHIGCVLHTHSVWGTLLSDLYYDDGGFFIEGYEMLKGLDGVATHEHREWVAIFDNTQDMAKLATQIRSRLEKLDQPLRHGFLIRRHGLYTWGETVEEARHHVEIFEFLFECVGRRLSWDGAATISSRDGHAASAVPAPMGALGKR